MKITVEIPIEPRQKYCVDKKTGDECPYVSFMDMNKYCCSIFFEVLDAGHDGDSIRCKQCKEAGK